MASNPVSNLTEEQYLAIERAAEFKSEFLDGVMYAMSGGSTRHSHLASNVLAELRAMLRSSECKAFNSDLLREYILVDQDKVLIEQYIRQDASTWILRDHQTLQ